MTDTPVISADTDVELGEYAERAYLDYAMSVVMGRALPMLPDGQKPVQRRILYAMLRLGLTDKTKHIKCARVVGEVLGKYHPHGDSSAYEAAVRMSQNFALRYPLIDGQGNFGDRDGSNAAAMRYTEARLTSYADLLLGELDQGTVDFRPNYDGTMSEPVLLPARLPMLLLNGASGIAVGMATEIPSHNLTEVADACLHLLRNPEATLADIREFIPGPDFPCGSQIISSPAQLTLAYESGRGSIRTRARWDVEQLARGQWQIAVNELPPGTSTAKVLLQIEALTNPQFKADKKALTQEQLAMKSLVLSVIEKIGDDSDGEHPVRIVIEPRSAKQTPEEVMQVLLANTDLEMNVPMNLVTIGEDGRPMQKGLLAVLTEWVAFRTKTVTRRVQHRLGQVDSRLHILEGRLLALAHIDEVIRIIRESDEPKAGLMARFTMSERQAEDILEIRLRQLANLEYVKITGEQADLKEEQAFLNGLLADSDKMRAQIISEVEADQKKFGDARRTLIESAERVTTATVAVTTNDPVTILVSKHGWLRARNGHKQDLSSVSWKAGDEAFRVFEARSGQTLVAFDNAGRAYNIAVSAIPAGRGDGVPLTALADLSGTSLLCIQVLDTSKHYMMSSNQGYGFLCPGEALQTRQKAGKAVATVLEGDVLFPPVALGSMDGEAVFAASNGRMLVCPVNELKVTPKARGVQLMSLPGKTVIVASTAFDTKVGGLAVTTLPAGKKGRVHFELDAAIVEGHRGHRARSGIYLPDKAHAVCITQPTAASGANKSAAADPYAVEGEDI